METPELDRLREALAAAEADVDRLRADNARLADEFRADPSDAMREVLRRGAAALTAARDRVAVARVALEIFEKTGSPYGLLAEAGVVAGTIAVLISPGTGRDQRDRLVDEAITEPLVRAASELGATLAATPARFTRERPGRDAEGRTVLDVAGRVEGDLLVPALTTHAKKRAS
jgi:hypothetical protein